MRKSGLILLKALIVILAVPIFSVSAAQYGNNEWNDNFHSEYKVGDVNDNGEVDICDLVTLKKYSAGNVNEYGLVYDAADCDGNGKVETMSGMSALRKYLLGISELS